MHFNCEINSFRFTALGIVLGDNVTSSMHPLAGTKTI